MVTRPTTKPEWATGTTAAITTPSAGKVSQGWLAAEKPPHQYHNWLFYWGYQWDAFFDSALFTEAGDGGQHNSDGDHWEVRARGASGVSKVVVYGVNGESSGTDLLALYDYEGGTRVFRVTAAGNVTTYSQLTAGNVVSNGVVSATGVVSGSAVQQSDTTNRYDVTPGLAGLLVSSGTRVESGASLGYSDNDGTTRTIRYWVGSKMPEHAVIRSVTVVAYLGHADNTVDATVYYTDNAVNSTRVSKGTITTITGSTGDQSAVVSLSGGGTNPAGQNGWWVDVETTNNNALSAYVSKIVVEYDVTRL